ncbi:hypothetical protein ACFSJ3_08145 [Corallincola platygyrae]|uniref:Uncharacterized protein n=1 Tax=Corallincola platygyrae TaxID=1193278 RepID=A0ABW4XMB7_9GAMM
MSIVLKIVGALLVVFGLVDIIGSFAGFDLWGEFIGVQLPDLLWKYSAYLEIALGYFMFKLSGGTSTQEEAEAESA